jgi:protein-S-isoprenylcysteine O-methyltransferase Ste14
MSIFKQLRAILLPVTVTIIVPLLLLANTPPNIGWGWPSPANVLPILAGLGFITGGLVLVVSTIHLFITVGQGTLAPWDPTQRLVVKGVYRYVRNPMISGVMAILLGETILFGSLPLLLWTLAFIAVNAVYIPLSEEPGLRARFGDDYWEYTRHVPRWIPRRTPWMPTPPPPP